MPATSGAFRASGGGGWPVGRVPATEPAARPPARRRAGIDHPRRTAVVISVLTLIFAGAVLLSGYVPFALSLRSAADLGSRDLDEFGRTRIGEVLIADRQGTACRKIQFHNDSGLFGPDVKVRCDSGLPEDQTAAVRGNGPNTGRLLSVRDAFIKR